MTEIMTGLTGLGLADPESQENGDTEDDKRYMETWTRGTVEGSPIVNSPRSPMAKRVDARQTPGPDTLNHSCTSVTNDALREWQECAKSIEREKDDKSKGQTDRRVLIVCSDASDDHDTGIHQENALRTELLVGQLGCLRRAALRSSLHWPSSSSKAACAPAPLTDLLRVHEFEYINHVRSKCALAAAVATAAPTAECLGDASSSSSSSNSSSSSSRHRGINPDIPPFYAPLGQLDTDTPLGPTSLAAATRFCGHAMWAVDAVMGGLDLDAELEHEHEHEHHLSTAQQGEKKKEKEQRKINRAFVVGRPPGHHAGPSGCVPPPTFFRVPGMTSSGVCVVNKVAVAAAYARYRYGRQALLSNPPTPKPRIAIVDIDIHHGNGTEAIVRNLTPHMQALPLPSSWAPQWRASYKPWLDESDAEDTFFGSVHLYAGDSFYPCTGSDEVSTFDSTKAAAATAAAAAAAAGAGTANVVNVALTPIGPGPWDPKTRAKLSASQLRQLTDAASAEMRTKVSSMLLPALHAFKPSLLLISAGFDAHYDDLYHFLTEADYHWMTGKVKANAQALDVTV